MRIWVFLCSEDNWEGKKGNKVQNRRGGNKAG
jgi:hypothetical protein